MEEPSPGAPLDGSGEVELELMLEGIEPDPTDALPAAGVDAFGQFRIDQDLVRARLARGMSLSQALGLGRRD